MKAVLSGVIAQCVYEDAFRHIHKETQVLGKCKALLDLAGTTAENGALSAHLCDFFTACPTHVVMQKELFPVWTTQTYAYTVSHDFVTQPNVK